MRIMITGCNGFVAGRLIKEWGRQDAFVGIARQKQPAIPGIAYIQADIADRLELFRKVKGRCGEVDIVIHCAAIIDGDVESLYRVNCLGTQNMVDLAKELRCQQFIYISSVPVIGSPVQIPVTEGHPVNPATVYHQTKYFGELITAQLAAQQIRYLVCRIPSPVGHGMPMDRIFSVFATKSRRGEGLEIYGDGQRVQNYLDVRDLAYALRLGIWHGAQGTYQIIGNSVSDYELGRRCLDYYQRPATMRVMRRHLQPEPEKWILSGAKAEADFGYAPRCSIEDSIAYVTG